MTPVSILTQLCNLPTAPFHEQHVVAWLLTWAQAHAGVIRPRRDKAGNLHLEYRHGLRGTAARRPPLILEAHMDHPGFVMQRQKRDGTLEALFYGGVKPSHFKDARVRFWTPADAGNAGAWVRTRVRSVKTIARQRPLKVLLAAPGNRATLPPGTLGMWDLPEAAQRDQLFAARVCDDLAGLAAIIAALDQMARKKAPAHVIALCSRAEEVGFAGVLAACENGWIPKRSPVIGLETSRAFPAAPQGAGPIIRVGDRTGIFSAGLTHFITQRAGHIADDDSAFKYQRKLMDGGTCNSTAFSVYGYDAAGICLALGNYHNMFDRAFIGPHAPHRKPVAKAGPGIASETIHLADYHHLVRLLVDIAGQIGNYRPGMEVVRKRFSKMHRQEQRALLYRNMPR
jgi:putative aminopeptidase FrvX